jgi:hypothetical protein
VVSQDKDEISDLIRKAGTVIIVAVNYVDSRPIQVDDSIFLR